MVSLVGKLRRRGCRISFTNGCFDLLHPGHVRVLQEAKRLGDILIVGLNSDASVRRIKGPGRPVLPASARAELLSALSCVDYIVIFRGPTPIPLLKVLKPDVLVKGGDYTPEEVVGADVVRSYGGRVVVAPLAEGYSTSRLIRRSVRASRRSHSRRQRKPRA